MNNRIKAPSLKSRADFAATVDHIAELQTERRRLEAIRDARIQQVQDEFGPAIAANQEATDQLITLAEKYAETHRDEILPGKLKSSETALARYGFRLGNPTLVLLNKKWSWQAVIDACKSAGLAKRFVRTKEEADKDAIKAANLKDEQLAGIGLRVKQEEPFYIEPKVEGGEAIKAEEGA